MWQQKPLSKVVLANSTWWCMKGSLWVTARQFHSVPVKLTDQALARLPVLTSSPFDFLWCFTPTLFRSNYQSFYALEFWWTLRPRRCVHVGSSIFCPITDHSKLQTNPWQETMDRKVGCNFIKITQACLLKDDPLILWMTHTRLRFESFRNCFLLRPFGKKTKPKNLPRLLWITQRDGDTDS